MEIVLALWNANGVPAIVISILAFILTYTVKTPYKLFTARIADENYRQLANLPIPLIPIGLGIGLWYAYCAIYGTITSIDTMLFVGVLCGAVAILIHISVGNRVEKAIEKSIKNKKLAEAIATTVAETEAMAEIVETVKKSKNPVKSIKKLAKEKAEVLSKAAAEKIEDNPVAKLYNELVKKDTK